MTRLPILVDPATDKVAVDGELIRLRHPGERAGSDASDPIVYVLLNKPRNVFSTNVAQGEQKRLIDLLPPDFPRVYPVGRLDHDARGLILLTNDGELTHRLTHLKFGVAKSYRAVVDGFVSPETLEKLRSGVWLADPKTRQGFKTGQSRIRIVERNPRQTTLEITIREGRNRQVRRMMARVGHKVRDLLRVKFGPLTLEGVGVGKWRLLTPGEIKRLRGATEAKPRTIRPATAKPAGVTRGASVGKVSTVVARPKADVVDDDDGDLE
jgi:23S rRNA pseudouridine2605 synthase